MITRKNTALPILGLAAGLIVAPLMAQPSERPQRGPQGERPAMGQRGPQAERPAPAQRGPQAERPAPGQRGQMPAPRERLQQMQQHLDLSPEQSTQIREIMRREMTAMQALRQDAQGDPRQRQAEAQALRQKMQAEIRAVLTPEQQAKLDAQRAEAPRAPRAPKAEKN